MGKYLRISSYIRKLFLIYDFATAPLWISLYVRKILFYFLSVYNVQDLQLMPFTRRVCRAARVSVNLQSHRRAFALVSAKMPRGVITGLPADQHFCRYTFSDSQAWRLIALWASVEWQIAVSTWCTAKNIRVSRGWIYATEGENVVQAYLHRHCYCAVLKFFSYQATDTEHRKKG